MSARPPMALALTALAAAGCVAALLGRAEGAGAPGPAVVVADARHPGTPVPRSFLGLSIEYPSVPGAFGPPGRPNRALDALIQALAAAQQAPLTVRVGGNSADEAWWNPGGRRRPAGIVTDVSPAWVAGLAAAQRRLGTPVTAGLDLAHADPANAVALARALVAALPAGGLSALEVGNEPDRYTRRRMSPRREGAAALAALRTSYDPARYAADVAAYAAALSPLVPGRVRLAVGGFAGTAWDAALPALLRRHRGLVGEVTAHAYALRGCHGRRPAAVLRSRLLSGAVSRRLVAQVAPALRAARGAGLPLQVTELNSASCGGIRGVSDAFASALWAPGALFALATAGVRGVDVHTWAGAAYAPFAVRHGPGVPRVEARPLFYGLLLFALATPYPSRLLPVQATGDVRAWATADGRAARVVAVNGARRRRRLRIAVRGARGAAGMLLRLRAPGPGARGHVTLGGRAIGAGGHPDAPWRPTRVTARRGWYAVSLPAASAVLLTVPVREPGASSPGRAGGVAAGGRW